MVVHCTHPQCMIDGFVASPYSLQKSPVQGRDQELGLAKGRMGFQCLLHR